MAKRSVSLPVLQACACVCLWVSACASVCGITDALARNPNPNPAPAFPPAFAVGAAFQSSSWAHAARARRPRASVRMNTPSHSQQQPHAGPYQGPLGTPLLDNVRSPADLKPLNARELKQLANELRWETLHSVSKVGGHLGSSLGVIELTVALHKVFDAPEDKIIWDVSHQCYPHKILTGRRDRMHTLRQLNGLSGFTKRAESEYDCFGAGHSSTSISAALGMAVGKSMLNKRKNNCIAVIGDGAITGGMAYEAMNNAAYINQRVVVVLNDNGQVSLPTGTASAGGVVPAGALSTYTGRLLSSSTFKSVRDMAKTLNKFMPEDLQRLNERIDEYARGFLSGGTLFEELGFYYVGPVDGHDLDNLVPILENIRDNVPVTKPVLLHVKTEKGMGYPPAMAASDKYHGVGKFDVATGHQFKSGPSNPSYTSIFANTLIGLAEIDRTVVGITAAMPGGTGMAQFGKRFPKRTFDVGIAEQHAVTFAAGMAVEGLKPFCCIYSTFMQRAYDQVIHDVVLQHLPVRMILDRAGLVGNDGPTHHGSYDLAYLGTLPQIVIMAPSDEIELMNMIQTAYEIDDLPSVVRYPRGVGFGLDSLNDIFGYGLKEMPTKGTAVPIGKGRIMKQAPPSKQRPRKVAIMTIGTRLSEALEAAKRIESEYPDVGVTVADARFMKPLDHDMIRSLAVEHEVMITAEEGAAGGFGEHVTRFLSQEGLLDDGRLRFRSMVLPDDFIEAGPQKDQYDTAGLNAPHIVEMIKKLVSIPRSAPVPVDNFISTGSFYGSSRNTTASL